MKIEDVEQRTIDDLDVAFGAWAAQLTPEEVDALQAYQSSERAYRLVNGVLRGSVDHSSLEASESALVAELLAQLPSALSKGELASPVTVWRGLSNLARTFGASPADAASLVGTERRLAGFASCTVVEDVARDEFADTATGALLRIRVPAGVGAAWLPPVGDSDFADEYELLLEDDLIFRVLGTDVVDGIVVLDCEVRP